MAWNISERFPSWGETGEFPSAGFFYEGGDQVNEKHLDALWNGVNGLEEDVQAALSDIDSNADGVVDKAEAGAAGFDLDGDLLAAGGEVIWDESANYIPQPRLQNDDVTFTAGDGLTGGGTVNLGGSSTLDVNVSDFAGTHLSDDGSNNLQVNDDFVLNTGDAMSGPLNMSSNSVTNILTASFNTGGSISDTTNGALEFSTSGGKRGELNDSGNLLIEGELTEGSAL